MKLSILFVDDEANVISGLKRMLRQLRKDWQLYFAGGAKEAIEILESNKIDVIISDIRMPGIDGTQLLTKVQQSYPHIVRITLSGYANDNLALKNTKIAHQSLSKPATPESIKSTIEKTYELRKRLNNDELLSLINGMDKLPSIPEVYLNLEEEINSPNSSIDKLGKIIVKDPFITAKILQLTNSAFFGLPNRISNITQALNMLGVNTIKALVLSIELFKSHNSNSEHAKIYEDIWNHSNKVASLAQKMAQICKLSKTDIDDAYLGGLLHDIGKIILLEKTNGIKIEKDLGFDSYEQNFKNIMHADVGAYLLGLWGLPNSIVETVAFHHSNISAQNPKITPINLVNLANRISKDSEIDINDITKEKIEVLFKKYEKG